MGRITALIEQQRKPKGPPCMVGVALAKYDKAEHAEWVAYLNASMGDVPHAHIARALKDDSDVQVTAAAISRHRNGECVCGTD